MISFLNNDLLLLKCPFSQVLCISKPLFHRSAIQNDDDKLPIVELNLAGKARTSSISNSRLYSFVDTRLVLNK